MAVVCHACSAVCGPAARASRHIHAHAVLGRDGDHGGVRLTLLLRIHGLEGEALQGAERRRVEGQGMGGKADCKRWEGRDVRGTPATWGHEQVVQIGRPAER